MATRVSSPVRMIAWALVLALAGCGTSQGSSPPAPSRTPGSASSAASAPTSTSTAATPTGSPAASSAFDPAHVRITADTVTNIPGNPLGIVSAADGSARLFVVDKTGRIWIVRDGTVGERPFLDIASKVSKGSEQGLLGLAFHPGFRSNGRFYIDYTNRDGDTVVSEWRVSASDPDAADAHSEREILAVDQPFANHNGGDVVFGPDGYLYITLGDGGSGGDPQGNAQRDDTLLGKILRIDVDQQPGGAPYGIPPDNPISQANRGRPRSEIFTIGMRNPWRIAFDSTTKDLWIGDVGQNRFEEIDVLRAGTRGLQNFGWNRMEGFHCYPSGDSCSTEGLTMPVSEYGRDFGCSVTGGVVARGNAPIIEGAYLFSDYCSGTIWAIDAARDESRTPSVVGETGASISSFGVGDDGTIYATDLSGKLLVLKAAPR